MPDSPRPLEDNYADILGKAKKGLGLAESDLAARAGSNAAAIRRLMDGAFDEGIVRSLAPLLGLDADALAAIGRGEWGPEPAAGLPGFQSFACDYLGMSVNCYAAGSPESPDAVLFDTGTDREPILRWLGQAGKKLRMILLTHGHGDHVAALESLVRATGAEAWIGQGERAPGAKVFEAGKVFEAAGLRIETRRTAGHSPGGTTYVVGGLGRPVAVVGDALFAGSMGGVQAGFATARETVLRQILGLPPETVLAPGHGPLTTVAEERAHNPFFAASFR